MTYPVVEVFKSVQGEGHFVGYPMVFVRLAGCSVTSCRIRRDCDEAPWRATKHRSASELIDDVQALQSSGIVCITGGEPTDHDLIPLVSSLNSAGYRVHLETSGKEAVTGLPIEWLTASPKTDQYRQRHGHTLKVVVSPEWGDVPDAWRYVAGLDADTNFLHRYLQPLYRDGKPVDICRRYSRW